jgi:hypothetical protein
MVVFQNYSAALVNRPANIALGVNRVLRHLPAVNAKVSSNIVSI